MYEFYPYFTNDGSVGLYSPEVDDIYHSTYGALTEAYEKFILPADFENYFKNKNEIKILDICFGIGYNSKSFINNFIKNIYNYPIGSDNIISNDKIHTNNKKYKIFIHAIDKDKNLILLSPFFKNKKSFFDNNKNTFNQKRIEKLLNKNYVSKYKLEKETNIILLNSLKKLIKGENIELTKSKKYSKFFDSSIIRLFEFYKNDGCKYTLLRRLSLFLHNIYYKYISASHKKALKVLKNVDFCFKYDFDDARMIIKEDANLYDYMFLDAFTPAKCPCLWTIDFFKELYSHLNEDGMILTYSNSAQIRNAFLEAGFFIGKIFSESQNKFTGTVAVKNKSLIKYELSDFDLGLLKTKAGIFYRDKNLNLPNEAIKLQHEFDVNNSNLSSSTKFIKKYKNQHN